MKEYVGWIYGWPWQRKKLRKLGVKGKMKWRWFGAPGIFEYCCITEFMAEGLKKEYRGFWADAFTHTCSDGRQEFLDYQR